MGSAVRIVLYAPNDETAFAAASAAFDRILALEAVMSDYRPDSELSRLCDHAGMEPVPVSEDLFDVLSRAERISLASDGAFDVTVGDLTRLWRAAKRRGRLPDAAKIADARRRVGFGHVVLVRARRTVRFAVPGIRLDLGGIGKGYAADAAAAVLRARSVRRFLVDMGGDLVLGDPPPDRNGWVIDIETPRLKRPLVLHDEAVATSGDTERYIEVGGVRYSHILNPRTGLGLTDRLEVTVVAPNGTDADALASAVSVLGPVDGAALIRRYRGASVRIVDAKGEVLVTQGPAFEPDKAPVHPD